MAGKVPEIFAVAGEESANQYLVKIIQEFKNHPVKFSGIGFSSLRNYGFNLVFDSKNLAVMGAFELLSKGITIKKAFKNSLEYIQKNNPELVLLIDYGGFNLRLAKKIKQQSPQTKIYYFISPKFWAWGEKRALRVKNYVDKMFVIHPFEVEFYKKWGVEALFVGHPLLQEVKKEYFDLDWIESQKLKLGLSTQKKQLGILLGSRETEIKRHLEPFCKTAQILQNRYPNNLECVFVIPPSHDEEDYKKRIPKYLKYKIVKSNEPMERLALVDLCLVASGTATLQVGLLGKPMAIGYIMNPLTMYLAKKYVRGVKFAGLVNILSNEEVAKEFLQDEFKPQQVADYLISYIENEQKYNETKEKLLQLRDELGALNSYTELKRELHEAF